MALTASRDSKSILAPAHPPELTAEVFQARRQQLQQSLGQGVAIVGTAPQAVMHNDVEYRFRPDSDFYYLTGLGEPEAVAVLAPHHPEHQYILFLLPKEPEKEVWTGYRVGVEGAIARYGADIAYPISELEERLPEYLAGAEGIYYRPGHNESLNHLVYRHWQYQIRQRGRRGRGPSSLHDLAPLLHAQRQIKSEAEVALLRQAAAIAAEAHNLARQTARPGRYEYEIEALLDQQFRQAGGQGAAYPSIVAAGPNGCILHYIENNRRLEDGDLLLIDAGCSYAYYNSDITRTFPVNGRFSPRQRDLYALVLAAQEAAIAQVKPGNSYNQPHDTAVQVLTQGLVDLGLITPGPDSTLETLIADQAYKPFYMHRTGHWLGLDVHDVGAYKAGDEWLTFEPGMVLTVEPGLYISPDPAYPGLEAIAPEWRGIGIRIEDDVLVTPDGCEVLTAGTPKAIADLEF